MTSDEYRSIIRTIVINAIKRGFPGLKRKELEATATLIAKNVHARMYGANVDDVDSPIWYSRCEKTHKLPTIDAKDLLND